MPESGGGLGGPGGPDGHEEWRTVVTSRVLAASAVVLAIATVAVLIYWLFAASNVNFVVILLALALATGFVAGCARVVVTIGAAGVRVDSALLGFAWTTLALDDIADARVDHVSVGSWFGWGYRVTMGGTAMILQRGRGLVLELVSGKEFTITLPEPDWALAALERAADARGGTGSLDRP